MSVDLTGKRFDRVSVLDRAEKRAEHREPYYLCRCDCGQQFEGSACRLRKGKIKSCPACSRQSASKKRRVDRSGERVGDLLLLRQERGADGTVWYEAKCLAQRKGKECGAVVKVRAGDVQQGRTSSCGHHGKGWFTAKTFKIPSRISRDGEWWILLTRARRLLRLSRSRAKALFRKRARRHTFPEGLGGQAITYLAEKDVLEIRDERLQLLQFPVVPGHVSLNQAAKELRRSKDRIQEVMRDEFGQSSRKVKIKRRDGRTGLRADIPDATFQQLKTYFAEARPGPSPRKPEAATHDDAHLEPARPRDRRHKRQAEQIQEFCYNCRERTDDPGWSKIAARRVRDEFHRSTFTDAMARTYASRWAAKLKEKSEKPQHN
jgi:hypothetical protein